MAGYPNRIVTLNFPDLTEDMATDPIRVVVRNPALIPPRELIPRDVGPVGPDGIPEDREAMLTATYELYAKLIIGWRVYDADQPVQLDADFNVIEVEPVLLPNPPTAETVGKLPSAILNKIGQLLVEARNPQ